MQTNQHVQQPHDEEAGTSEDRDAFVPSRIYCVETICAPCGVVVAWAKFPKAESPTNILQFLDHVSQQMNQGLTISVLIKHALYCSLAWPMAVWKGGSRQADSLLTHITIQTTLQQIFFVINGAILHHQMVQHCYI